MRLFRSVALILALAISAGACRHNAPLLVGQGALAVAQSIETLSNAGKQLQEAAVLPTAVALGFQERLLVVNDKLKPLPDILRTIDRLQEAGDPMNTEAERAIAILTVVSQDISVVIAGVPVSDASKQLIDLVRAADQTVSAVLTQVARVRGN